MTRQIDCPNCDGDGLALCGACNGVGEGYTPGRTCRLCRGTGQNECLYCNGQGYLEEHFPINDDYPQG